MNLTGAEFLEQPQKAITLIGMSGVGKTWWGQKLAGWGWTHYSCDYQIATKYLKDYIKNTEAMSPDNISGLAKFVGQIGNPARGGMDLQTFRHFQKLYYEAERQVIEDAAQTISQNKERNFVFDSAGSLCEIKDKKLIARLGAQTLFIYIKASPEEEQVILHRAKTYPKPLFFPSGRFDEWLESFMQEYNVSAPEEIDPDAFLRWVFPKLFQSRLPKYRRLADLYGVIISSDKFKSINSEDEFLHVIAEGLAG